MSEETAAFRDVTTLVEMGFTKEKAEQALKVTNNKGVEPAMEWLLAHCNDPDPVPSVISSTSERAATSPAADASSTASDSIAAAEETSEPQAKSLKCDECGKLFKNQEEVEYHAAKTNHSSFSESTEEKKPLTEEEKKKQLALLEEKMKAKRKEREERDKAEALEKERLRIKSGKDLTDARMRMQELEMQKILEQRRRDKQEEKTARERVRAQIAADKEARRQAASGNKEPVAAPPVVQPLPTSPTKPKEYTETRIQLRLPDGKTLTQTFSSKEQLAAVRLYLEMQAEGLAGTPYSMMTNFPKKIFTAEDFDTPLNVLGLVPSAVIIVSKAPLQ